MSSKGIPVYRIGQFNDPVEGKDFYANKLPAHLRDHHFIHTPHKHDFFLVVFFTKGSGTHEIDFTSYPVKPGSIFLMSPGQTHNWKLSDDVDGFVFFHSEEFYNLNFNTRKIKDYPFFSSIYNSPLLKLKKKEFDRPRQLFTELLDEYKNARNLKFQKICSLIDLLYIELTRQYTPQKKSGNSNTGYLDKLRKLEE